MQPPSCIAHLGGCSLPPGVPLAPQLHLPAPCKEAPGPLDSRKDRESPKPSAQSRRKRVESPTQGGNPYPGWKPLPSRGCGEEVTPPSPGEGIPGGPPERRYRRRRGLLRIRQSGQEGAHPALADHSGLGPPEGGTAFSRLLEPLGAVRSRIVPVRWEVGGGTDRGEPAPQRPLADRVGDGGSTPPTTHPQLRRRRPRGGGGPRAGAECGRVKGRARYPGRGRFLLPAPGPRPRAAPSARGPAVEGGGGCGGGWRPGLRRAGVGGRGGPSAPVAPALPRAGGSGAAGSCPQAAAQPGAPRAPPAPEAPARSSGAGSPGRPRRRAQVARRRAAAAPAGRARQAPREPPDVAGGDAAAPPAGPRRGRQQAAETGCSGPGLALRIPHRMSQQHPLIIFLLLIVAGACLALLAVFFALRLVMSSPRAPGPGRRGRTRPEEPPAPRAAPRPGRLSAFSARPRPARLERALRAGKSFPWEVLPQNKSCRGVWTRWTAAACVLHLCAPASKLAALSARHPLQRVSSESAPRLSWQEPLPGSRDGILVWIGLRLSL